MAGILVAEDDPRIASLIVGSLKREGFEVELVPTGHAALEKCFSCQFDLILLDLGLPDESGFDMMADLRHRCSAPIVVITSRQDLEVRLRVFRSGAVDWMSKPFFIEELIERIRVRITRWKSEPTKCITVGRLNIDLERRSVELSATPISLGAVEFNVLVYLIERNGRAISRQQLIDNVLPPDTRHTERTVDSHIAHIRRKLGDAGRAIRTAWGIGYRFDGDQL